MFQICFGHKLLSFTCEVGGPLEFPDADDAYLDRAWQEAPSAPLPFEEEVEKASRTEPSFLV